MRRNRAAVALAALALAAAVAGVVGTSLQARKARAERDFALRQLSRAQAINDLNEFLLSESPADEPINMSDLLERAEHIVGRQQGTSLADRVETLISIGRNTDVAKDGDAKARRVLEEAYRLSRGAEHSTRARASCALADLISRRAEERPRAERLVQEGLGELPSEPQFLLDRVFCLLSGGVVARADGASKLAIARTEEARRSLKQSPFQPELLDLDVSIDLADSYRLAGQNREACASYEQAATRLAALGRDDTGRAGSLFYKWSLPLSLLGRPLEAERLSGRAIAIFSNGPNGEGGNPVMLVSHARTLADLGRLKEAAEQAERAYASAQATDYQAAINQALLARASIYRRLGDLSRAESMLAELEPRLRRSLPAGNIYFASLASEQALVAQGRGDLHLAQDRADQAIAIADASIKAGRPGADFLPILVLRRSFIELDRHDANGAAMDAARALALLEQAAQPGTFSSHVGNASMALGQALRAQGKEPEAGAALRSAAEHLQKALGPDHPDALRALQLAQPPIQTH